MDWEKQSFYQLYWVSTRIKFKLLAAKLYDGDLRDEL